ncbi:MAG TPA: HAMP domain-containing sensor histidine kinase [Symbiobacteriaceae bacterium]|jgi:signal transduction histidine kinase
MRIGAKLLLTYFVLIALVALAAGVWVPTLVEGSVRKAEKDHLELQAQKLANRFGDVIRKRGDTDAASALKGLGSADNALAEETIAILAPNCLVVRSSDPQLLNKILSDVCSQPQQAKAPARRNRPTLDLGDLGQVPVWATVPLAPNIAVLQGYRVLLYRDMPFINKMTTPIARGLEIALVLGFLAAMAIAGWVSREMVKRLKDVGDAAGALAEGDLIRRAPETGKDEITEVAQHFNHMAERIQTLVEGLKRSEQSRKDLLMMVGHDLRTPLTSIAGFAEALRDGLVQDEEKRRRYYEIITSEAERLTRLVNDLFDVVKLESGQMELRLQAMPIAPVLQEFVESMKPNAESHGARIELELSPEAQRARVYIDRDRLEQVLDNLAGNALRFTPAGAAVTIRSRVEGSDVVVEVCDQGPGLTPEEAARVFHRFYQGANQGQSHKGAGLGLAIVKSLVEAHGGQVGVTSVPGQGASFWFKLNRAG